MERKEEPCKSTVKPLCAQSSLSSSINGQEIREAAAQLLLNSFAAGRLAPVRLQRWQKRGTAASGCA
jgi:hypothetical protein